tara:strand:+ start:108 stop:593 length:486 start_codon:yes stop_codon:yes gene_type:complete
MTDINKLLSPLFLKEKEIKKLMELLFLSYRDFRTKPDEILEKINFNRNHHRVIYFVGKNNKITIKELLKILQITKQSFSRIINQLVEKNYITMTIGFDKRTKNLKLTKKGIELEKKISDIQITRLKKILQNANENELNGFKKILFLLIGAEGRKIYNKLNN